MMKREENHLLSPPKKRCLLKEKARPRDAEANAHTKNTQPHTRTHSPTHPNMAQPAEKRNEPSSFIFNDFLKDAFGAMRVALPRIIRSGRSGFLDRIVIGRADATVNHMWTRAKASFLPPPRDWCGAAEPCFAFGRVIFLVCDRSPKHS